MSRRLVAIAAAVLACAIPFVASAALSKASGDITIYAELSPVGSFEGTSKSLRVADDGKELKFTVPVNSIDTGIGLRNGELVERFTDPDPKNLASNVVLTVPRDQVKFPTDKPTKGTVKGKLSINHVEVSVPVNYEASKSGNDIVVKADFKFDYKPHHHDRKKNEKGKEACKLGVCVESEIKVELTGAHFKE